MDSNRDSARAAAGAAQLCNMFPEMIEHVVKMAACAEYVFSEYEQELLSNAFKRTVDPLRVSWRVLWHEEKKQEAGANERLRVLAREEKNKVEQQLLNTAHTAIKCAQKLKRMQKNNESPRFAVVLDKMIGDFSRYLVDVYMHYPAPDIQHLKKELIEQADLAYKSALACSEANDEGNSTVFLGICLNYSLFQFEVLGKPRTACVLARNALEFFQRNDVGKIKELPEQVAIVHKLRDNLVRWTSIRS